MRLRARYVCARELYAHVNLQRARQTHTQTRTSEAVDTCLNIVEVLPEAVLIFEKKVLVDGHANCLHPCTHKYTHIEREREFRGSAPRRKGAAERLLLLESWLNTGQDAQSRHFDRPEIP